MDAPGRSAPTPARLETAAAFAVIVLGVLLHFAYGWSGDSRAVAAVAPANESVWEHLKMVLVPVLVVGGAESRWFRDRPRLWWAKLVEIVAASVAIVAFFYTYTGALGVDSVLAADVLSFLAAVAGGQWLSLRIIGATATRTPPLAVSALALACLVVAFGVLTFAPPHVPLFHDTSAHLYGPL